MAMVGGVSEQPPSKGLQPLTTMQAHSPVSRTGHPEESPAHQTCFCSKDVEGSWQQTGWRNSLLFVPSNYWFSTWFWVSSISLTPNSLACALAWNQSPWRCIPVCMRLLVWLFLGWENLETETQRGKHRVKWGQRLGPCCYKSRDTSKCQKLWERFATEAPSGASRRSQPWPSSQRGTSQVFRVGEDSHVAETVMCVGMMMNVDTPKEAVWHPTPPSSAMLWTDTSWTGWWFSFPCDDQSCPNDDPATGLGFL